MVLTEIGLAKVFQRVKSFVASQLNSKASAIHTHTSSDITDLPDGLVVDSTLDGTSSNAVSNSAVSNALDGKSNTGHTHTVSNITDFPTLATVATSGSYNDLDDRPTIPTVNNATLKIQKNGTDVKTFTANASSNVTCNITVPTKVSELTNDSGFLTSHQSLSNYSTLANTIKSLSISGKTITYTKGDNTTGTLTTQDNNTWTAMKGATSSANGSVGYVNAVPPKDGYNTKYLRADGTWQVPPDHTYTVNNATLTIQKNGSKVATFTSNASSNVTCNITVPTKVSQLTNDNRYTVVLTANTISWDWGNAYPDKVGIRIDTSWMGGILTTANTSLQSDGRLKNTITNIDDSLLDAWKNIEPKQYKFNDASEKKGEQARFHTGYIAQDIEKACADNNIDATRYGLFCFNSWDEQPEVTEDVEVEKDGVKTTETRIVQEKREKGDMYALRYEEALVVECAYLRRENSRLKENLASIEERLKKLENQEK